MSDTDSDVEIIETVTGSCPCCGYHGELSYVDQDTTPEPEPTRGRKRRRAASPEPERRKQAHLSDFFNKIERVESSAEQTDNRSYIQAVFDEYPNYPYESSSPTMLEFYRMCEFFDWKRSSPVMEDARTKIRNALTRQFNTIYGTDENDLLAWQNLCRVLELQEVPDELFRCRQAVKSTFVNIVDLVDTAATEEPVRHFGTEMELSEYTQLTGKYFPQDSAEAGGLLKFLLRHIFHPGSRRDRTCGRPQKRARIDP